MTTCRVLGLDTLKGFLVINVIIGHVLLGEISQNIGREIIYFFHMPVFLAVSGYFTSTNTLNKSCLDILTKCKIHILRPFTIAFILYTSLDLGNKYINQNFELLQIPRAFLYPDYHLWYIPAFLIFIFYTKFLERKQEQFTQTILFTSFLLTILYYTYLQPPENNFTLKMLGDKRFYGYYYYFLCGYIINKHQVQIDILSCISLFIIGTTTYIFTDNELLIGISKTVTNSSLIFLMIEYAKKIFCTPNIFSTIGRFSLPIYLWHVLPLVIIKNLSLQETHYYFFSSFFLFYTFMEQSNYTGHQRH